MRNFRALLTIVLLSTFLGSEVFGLNQADRTAAIQLYRSFFPNNGPLDRQRLRNATDSERELLKPFLWEKIRDQLRDRSPQLPIGGSMETIVLAAFGDDWAREMVVSAYLSAPRWGPREDPLYILNDPKVISLIAEHLFKEERVTMGRVDEAPTQVGELEKIPTQDSVRRVILQILTTSSTFNPEVEAWARRLKEREFNVLVPGVSVPVFDPDGTRVLREWYRANEGKLKAWDFKVVQPGAEPPTHTEPKPKLEPTIPILAVQTPTPSRSLKTTSPAEHLPRSGMAWTEIALLLVVSFVALGLFYFFHKNRP